MRLYNTLTREKEEFVPVIDRKARLYTCGPTVYDFAHIGNFRTYVFEDLLRRWLKYRNFDVKQVMNLTDVDDKTIRNSQAAGIPLAEFTQKYINAFFEDLDALNIERAEVYPRATEHVNEMVAMIKVLLEKGVAYKSDDGIYYAISKFKNYGKLAKIDVKQLKAGASGRVLADEYEKENVGDFALWKMWDENDGDVFWETDIGKGRPGWHIECSAMSTKHLTDAFSNSTFHPEKFETIDIHTGGVDNIFPHHQDEIAQNEGCVAKPFSKYWMHSEHLIVDGKKMSKSLGNFYTLRDLLNKGYHPLAIRYALLSVHYRQKLNFTLAGIDAAAAAIQRLNDFMLKLTEASGEKDDADIQKLIEAAQEKFERALDDDLEISPALAAVFDFVSEINKHMSSLSKADAQKVTAFMEKVDTVLGVLSKEEPLSEELQTLINEREKAREAKDWKRSDELRDELKQKNIVIEDTPHGTRWKRVLS